LFPHLQNSLIFCHHLVQKAVIVTIWTQCPMSGHSSFPKRFPYPIVVALGILAVRESSALYKMLAHAILNEEYFETRNPVGDSVTLA